MPKLFAIGLIAALSAVAPSYASEDAAPYVFGGDVNYEVQGQDSIASQFTSGEDDLFNFSDVESLSAEHTAIPAENPMEAPDDAAPMDENDIPDAEAIASPAENLPTASVPMLQAPGTTPPPPSSSAADEKTPMPKISKDQALTDTLKQDKTPGTAQNVIPLPKVEGTWVDKLATTNPLSILGDGKAKTSAAGTVQGSGDSLESLVESARRPSAGNSRSNASVFDISGVMLRMSLRQVDETMQNRGFRKIMQKYQIPNFIKWRNEEGCRHSGVVGYERLEACVVEKAKKAKQQYGNHRIWNPRGGDHQHCFAVVYGRRVSGTHSQCVRRLDCGSNCGVLCDINSAFDVPASICQKVCQSPKNQDQCRPNHWPKGRCRGGDQQPSGDRRCQSRWRRVDSAGHQRPNYCPG